MKNVQGIRQTFIRNRAYIEYSGRKSQIII